MRKLTKAQLERKLNDPCATCKEVEHNIEACVTCKYLHRAYLKTQYFDDPVELMQGKDLLIF